MPARRAPTAGVLQAIEHDALAPFDLEATANAGTGVLESYLDARGRRRAWTRVAPSAIALGVALGALLAVAVVVAGARTGLVVAFAAPVALVAALARRMEPRAAVAASTAALVGALVGAAFVVVPGPYNVPPFALVTAAGAAGVLGVAAVLLLRRAWLVDSPRAFPGAQGELRVVALAEEATEGAAGRARHALGLFAAAAGGSAAFALVREAVGRVGAWWDDALGAVRLPDGRVDVGVALSPLAVGVGALLDRASAWRFLAGSAVAALVLVPFAYAVGFPLAVADASIRPDALAAGGTRVAPLLFARVAVPFGAGCLAGVGLHALARSAKNAFALAGAARRPEPARAARGWYAWPRPAALAAAGGAVAALIVALAVGGASVALSVALALGVAFLVAVVGALAWNAFAEGDEALLPAVGLAALALVPLAALGAAPGAGVLAVAAFAAAVAGGAACLASLRTGLHAGARPYGQATAAFAAVVPAAAVGAFAASLFAVGGFARPPLASAVASLVDPGPVLAVGVLSGLVLAFSGLGAAFALGLLSPLAIAVPLAAGAFARAAWDRGVARRAEAEAWDRERRIMRWLDATLVAGGLVLGEALALVALAAWRALR